MIVTPIHTAIAMAKVTMMWLVKVKLPGIMPSMLPIRMNMKMREDDREEAHAFLAGGVAQDPGHELVHHLDGGLEPAGHHGVLARAGHDQQVGAADRDRHPQGRVGEGQVGAGDR